MKKEALLLALVLRKLSEIIEIGNKRANFLEKAIIEHPASTTHSIIIFYEFYFSLGFNWSEQNWKENGMLLPLSFEGGSCSKFEPAIWSNRFLCVGSVARKAPNWPI